MVVDQESLLNQIKMEIYHVAIKVGKKWLEIWHASLFEINLSISYISY